MKLVKSIILKIKSFVTLINFFLKVGPYGWNPGRLRMSTTIMAEVHVRRLLLHYYYFKAQNLKTVWINFKTNLCSYYVFLGAYLSKNDNYSNISNKQV